MPDFELTKDQCVALIRSQQVVRIAFNTSSERYLIPLGYVWFDGAFCGMTDEGRKTQMASENPHVSFQLELRRHGPFGWQSVTGDATFEVLADAGAIERLAPSVFDRFSDGPAWAIAELSAKADQGKAIFYQLTPRSFTGRAFTEKPPS